MIGSHDLRRKTRPTARDQGEDASSDGGYQGFLNGNGCQSRQCHLELDTPKFWLLSAHEKVDLSSGIRGGGAKIDLRLHRPAKSRSLFRRADGKSGEDA